MCVRGVVENKVEEIERRIIDEVTKRKQREIKNRK